MSKRKRTLESSSPEVFIVSVRGYRRPVESRSREWCLVQNPPHRAIDGTTVRSVGLTFLLGGVEHVRNARQDPLPMRGGTRVAQLTVQHRLQEGVFQS